jgi:hypothetical protein
MTINKIFSVGKERRNSKSNAVQSRDHGGERALRKKVPVARLWFKERQ